MSNFKSGFIAIIGRPNAGKSTLLNNLVGSKIAIVSEKPQTTRNQIRGIYSDARMQAVFVDTPGVHKPSSKLDERMMRAVTDSLQETDLVLYMVDVGEAFGKGEQYIINTLKQVKATVFLLLNKIDTLDKPAILPLLETWSKRIDAAEIIPLSASKGDNCRHLLDVIYAHLPEGPQYYPGDVTSDQPEQLLLAELVREQVLRHTSQEIPHAVAVTIAAMEERPENLLYVEANIYVERESQKGILIGKQGAMLKQIGSSARREMQRLLACPIYLDLRVKTKRDWRNNERLLKDWDVQE